MKAQCSRLGGAGPARAAPAARSRQQRLRASAAARPNKENGAAESKGGKAAQASNGSAAALSSGGNGAAPKAVDEPIPTVQASLDEFGSPKQLLKRQPLSGGVKNATARFELPTPAVAVRNLVEQAQYGHLSTVMSAMHHRRAGYPFGSVADFACDGAGYPIFSLSPLAMHTRNLITDPRCTLVVQMPGWQGLSNARATIFGEVYRLPDHMQDEAREIFAQKHATGAGEHWIGGNYSFYRMHHISDIYFVGGFGTVQWVDLAEFTAATPDPIVINRMQVTLQQLNEDFSPRLKELISSGEQQADDAAIISVDKMGIDIRVRFGHDYTVERLGFNEDVHTLEVASAKLKAITSSAETFHAHNRSAGPSRDVFCLFRADLSGPSPKQRDQ